MTGLGLRLGNVGDIGSVEVLEQGKAIPATATMSWDLWRASERKNLTIRMKGGKGKRYAIIRSDGIEPMRNGKLATMVYASLDNFFVKMDSPLILRTPSLSSVR